ncbi:MAG: hypothetical protein AAFU71_00160 [Cyanobacteria bacterium J06632_22]
MNWFKKLTGKRDEQTEPSYTEEVVGWKIILEGTVESTSKTDIDKSGRNPKYMAFFTVKKEKESYENCDFELGEKVRFRIKEVQLTQALGRQLKTGDRVKIHSTGTDSNPRILSVSKVSLCE